MLMTSMLPKALTIGPTIILTCAAAFGVAPAQDAQSPTRQRGYLWLKESEAAVTAENRADVRARFQALSKLYSDFPENSRVLRNLAWAEQKAGNEIAATALLKKYAEMGMTLDLGGPIYSAMAEAKLLAKVPELDRNRSPITSGTRVFTLPDPDLLVEDIAFEPHTARYFLTCIRKKKIISCDQNGQCTDIVSTPPLQDLDAMLAIRVDAAHNVVWATTSGMPTQEGFRAERKGRSAVLKFDIRTFRLLRRYEPADGKEHALGDMTVASNGDAYISDGLSGDVYVIKHDTDKLERMVPHGVFVSPQTPTLNQAQSVLYVPDYVEGIAVIQVASAEVQWLKVTTPLALEGIDGLYWTHDGLIATQNGTVPERVVRFHLRDQNTADGFSVIEANWPGLGDPTHGVIVGDFFYFIVNSGWDRVGEDESSFRSGAPAQVWKVPTAHPRHTTVQRPGETQSMRDE